jgi:nitroreductase
MEVSIKGGITMETMDYQKIMKERHSVRAYLDKPIEASLADQLQQEITSCNQESGLHIQLFLQEPLAFGGLLTHYGQFKHAVNYLAIVGDPQKVADSSSPIHQLEEAAGYYGEKLVLFAQQLGLNTCWVGGTYRKGKCPVKRSEGEKLVIIISIGYGENQGHPHRSKPMEKLCVTKDPMPDWFRHGMEAALLAPTAINQQKFKFKLLPDNKVSAETARGPFAKVDLGIAKYHFEIGADPVGWEWVEP